MRPSLLLGLLLLGWDSPAVAAPAPRAHLLYVRETGAERCPEERGLRDAVAARLGYDPFTERAPLTVLVTLLGTPKGLRARIELIDEMGETTGTRQLVSRASDCRELASALELAISIAIDPMSLARGPVLSVGPEAPAETEPAGLAPDRPGGRSATSNGSNAAQNETEKPPPAFPPAPRRGNWPQLRVAVGALASIASAPEVAFGFTAQVGLRRPAWSVGIEGRADLPASASVAGGTITTRLLVASAVPCYHLSRFAGCALVTAGAQYSAGSQFFTSFKADSPYLGVGARLAAEFAFLGRYAVSLHADLLVPLTIIQLFVLDVSGTKTKVWEAAPVSGRFGVALVGYFL